MNSYRVYLVEDEENLAQVLQTYMKNEGWEIRVFHDGETALNHIEDDVQLWILDIMLPGINGYELVKQVKAGADTPVIFISARDEDLDRIVGLEAGSDDYLAKPFLPKELVIRAKKLLQRVYDNAKVSQQYFVSKYEIDPLKRTVMENGQSIELTVKELDIVLYLLDHKNETKSRDDILRAVWGEDYFGSDRAVDDVIRRIRKKMPRLDLETMYGSGYRILTT
jgi:two-component system response regulator CssR